MDITTQISKLIESVKAQPNSLARNKVTSSLENARVWSKELVDKFAGLEEPEEQKPTASISACICTEMGVRRDCPVHGS